MVEQKSLVDKAITRVKNNRVLAIVIVLGIIVITISTFTDAVRNLLGVLPKMPEHPSFDISGYWSADKTDKTPNAIFNFKVVGNQLFGTVQLPSSMSMPRGTSGIIDGKVIGDTVSFSTKHEYVKQFGQYNFKTGERTPNVWEQFVTHYQGKIAGNEIRFMRHTDEGFYAEFTAKKVVDKTITSSKQSDTYILLYSLPGHEGGVCSLSFGPEDGRFSNGGLRLSSGGVKDCQVKWWNLATAESYGNKDMCQHLPEGKAWVTVAYRPTKRDVGAVDLQSVSVAENGTEVQFFDWVFFSNGTGGGGGPKEIQGVVGKVSISADLTRIATAETGESGKSTISIRYSSGGIVRSLACKGLVGAVAFSRDGGLVAIGEKTESAGSVLRLWSVANGAVKWATKSQVTIDALAFSPNGSLLIAGGLKDDKIEIRQIADGTLRLTLPLNQKAGVSSLIFSDNGRLLAAAGLSSNTIRILDVKNSFSLKQTLDNERPVGALAFSRDGRLLASGDATKGEIKVWGKDK